MKIAIAILYFIAASYYSFKTYTHFIDIFSKHQVKIDKKGLDDE